MLQLDHCVARDDVGAMRPNRHLGLLGREVPFPGGVPGGLRLGPWVTVEPGVVRPVPCDDLAAFTEQRFPAHWTPASASRRRLDADAVTAVSQQHRRSPGFGARAWWRRPA